MFGVPWCQKTASRPSGVIRTRVVDMERATVVQLQIELRHHWLILNEATRSARRDGGRPHELADTKTDTAAILAWGAGIPHQGSGPSPQPTNARCARGEELQGERSSRVGPVSCLTDWRTTRPEDH